MHTAKTVGAVLCLLVALAAFFIGAAAAADPDGRGGAALGKLWGIAGVALTAGLGLLAWAL
jgi:hypothetical protein